MPSTDDGTAPWDKVAAMADPYAPRRFQGQGHDQSRKPSSGLATLNGSSSRDGYEAGESSAAGSFSSALPIPERYQYRLSDVSSPNNRQSDGSARKDDRSRRRHKSRSSSAFLLPDAVPKERTSVSHRNTASTLPLQPKPFSPAPDPIASRDKYSSLKSAAPSRLPRSPAQQDASQLDADSTQIVHMALNLSESRRLAARKPSNRGNPPKLAPIPDATVGGNLKYHLQQQRKSSRNISPKPHQGTSPRIPSVARVGSPLQSAFDSISDGRYRYQFSTSTLARAQKAKEHLELMAEYRRLIEHLPPLKPGAEDTLAPVSTATTAPGANTARSSTALGRLYNPLQYIRNRKVRARERKVIDGEAQGFGDVESVRLWVDKLEDNTSRPVSSVSDMSLLPPFVGADDSEALGSPEAAARNASRPRRPRVDWFIEPCDLIADAYWLEQDHHKQLIEDRRWRKIFPAQPQAGKPPLQGQPDHSANATSPFPLATPENPTSIPEVPSLNKADTNLSQNSAKERAKQKLQDIRGFHHRHTSSVNHDFLRVRRDSLSDLSDSDNESKADSKRKTRHGRSGTITSNANDLLEKQMLEMIAKEAYEQGLANVPEVEAEDQEAASNPAPKQKAVERPGRFQSRKGSMADTSDSDHRPLFERPQWRSNRSGRRSLDVSDAHWQGSVDNDSSLPTSPDLRPSRGVTLVPTLGLDASPPSSRSPSPTRNPLARVKNILREKSREAMLHLSEETKDEKDARSSAAELIPTPETLPVAFPSQNNEGKPTTRSTEDAYRAHRRSHSMLPRVEEQASGLRGMFKGPRIDTVIRGGKDGMGEPHTGFESHDESDSDSGKARQRSSTISHSDAGRVQDSPSYPPTNFLPAMPEPGAGRHNGLGLSPDSHLPPKIDIRGATSSAAPSVGPTPIGESETSDADSYPFGMPDASKGRAERPDSTLIQPLGTETGHRTSPQLSKREVARMRALILSSGIKAMEINRRAYELQQPLKSPSEKCLAQVPWPEIAKLSPDLSNSQQIAACEGYSLAAQALGISIQTSSQRWQNPDLQKRICMSRRAADEADETSKDLALGQPLKVKHVRRRSVEWGLVGLMWYVWFVVMILRIFLGVGKGVISGVRWLLWL
ncbi:hypothetical protein B0I35DRAFT_430444 [Stachybotrys elegans]|uniref:Uncharacterized protein n=1 Tax=Stachybotrys elegans TaxID=80388 RepID=A0A8K0WRZ3_9HYPO|nr:hypothetical protein B0I35DRAFT_430444 [Stachybotrys elegans]